jgi:hypothetical protein
LAQRHCFLSEGDAVPPLPQVPTAKKDEGIKMRSRNRIWTGDFVHVVDVKTRRQFNPKSPPEGGGKRTAKEQMQSSFRLTVAQVT